MQVSINNKSSRNFCRWPAASTLYRTPPLPALQGGVGVGDDLPIAERASAPAEDDGGAITGRNVTTSAAGRDVGWGAATLGKMVTPAL